MMTQQSTELAMRVPRLESGRYPAFSSQGAIAESPVGTEREYAQVIEVAFGEWPVPKMEHPDSKLISKFIHELELAGFGEDLKKARATISDWYAPAPSLKKLRLEAGLSQEQLAELMETSQPQIARMESGRQDLRISTVTRLAKALNIDVHRVIDAATTEI